MRLVIKRYGLQIEPEDEQDDAYIEEVLKLLKDGDIIKLKRHNVVGLDSIACLETEWKTN